MRFAIAPVAPPPERGRLQPCLGVEVILQAERPKLPLQWPVLSSTGRRRTRALSRKIPKENTVENLSNDAVRSQAEGLFTRKGDVFHSVPPSLKRRLLGA